MLVEHRLARLVQLGIRQSRYFGRVKTRFQLYLADTVANPTLVAAKASLTVGTGDGSSVGTPCAQRPSVPPLTRPCASRSSHAPGLACVGLTAEIHPIHLPGKGFPARFLAQQSRFLPSYLRSHPRGRIPSVDSG